MNNTENSNKNVVIGQLVIIISGGEWKYGVVEDIFDDKIIVLKKNGSRFMYDTKKVSVNHVPEFLTSNDEPVMSGKNIFGRYTFKPKKEDK